MPPRSWTTRWAADPGIVAIAPAGSLVRTGHLGPFGPFVVDGQVLLHSVRGECTHREKRERVQGGYRQRAKVSLDASQGTGRACLGAYLNPPQGTGSKGVATLEFQARRKRRTLEPCEPYLATTAGVLCSASRMARAVEAVPSRRHGRLKVKPLAFWANEKIERTSDGSYLAKHERSQVSSSKTAPPVLAALLQQSEPRGACGASTDFKPATFTAHSTPSSGIIHARFQRGPMVTRSGSTLTGESCF